MRVFLEFPDFYTNQIRLREGAGDGGVVRCEFFIFELLFSYCIQIKSGNTQE